MRQLRIHKRAGGAIVRCISGRKETRLPWLGAAGGALPGQLDVVMTHLEPQRSQPLELLGDTAGQIEQPIADVAVEVMMVI